MVLQGGRVIDVWNLARKGPRVQVNVEALVRLTPWTRDAIESEAALLAAYLGGELELRFTGT